MIHQSHIKKYLKKWDLTLTEDAVNSTSGLILFVQFQEKPAILKIFLKDGEEQQATALQYYKRQGAIHLLKHDQHAILMERAIPGISLKPLTIKGEDQKATDIFCTIIQKLHSKEHKFTKKFSSIIDWGQGFDRYIFSDSNQISRDLILKAKTIFDDLLASQNDPILLHGDLHHENILYDQKRGWLAIDPKGVIGEPCYEIGAFLRNPIDRPEIVTSPKIIETRLNLIHDRLGYPKKRILGWAFSQAVLSGIWFTECGECPIGAIKAADAFQRRYDQ